MDFDDLVNEIRRCGPVWEADRIAALESQLAQYRWRRVDEEMPEANKTVLMWDGLDVEIGHRTVCGDGKLRWVEPFSDEYRQAEYWMPLPPAPEEGE